VLNHLARRLLDIRYDGAATIPSRKFTHSRGRNLLPGRFLLEILGGPSKSISFKIGARHGFGACDTRVTDTDNCNNGGHRGVTGKILRPASPSDPSGGLFPEYNQNKNIPLPRFQARPSLAASRSCQICYSPLFFLFLGLPGANTVLSKNTPLLLPESSLFFQS